MIKIALKHWIYEKCINVLFDSIHKNFVVGFRFNFSRVKVGDKFTKIIAIYPMRTCIMYNCTVSNINIKDGGFVVWVEKSKDIMLHDKDTEVTTNQSRWVSPDVLIEIIK